METSQTVSCPHCRVETLDTVTDAPYVRGFLLGYAYGTKRFVGCDSCVKKQLAGEVGMSMLTGWFSFTALLVNPMCILWNGLRMPFIKADPVKVNQLLTEMGVSTREVDLPRVAACLAAAMVAADGKVEQDGIVLPEITAGPAPN